MHPALLVLALGGFGIGMGEFLVAGLLPQIAADLSVTAPTAGLLITGYAATVAVAAVSMTAVLCRLARRSALLVLVALFVVGNVVGATATSYRLLLLGRVVAALCHGSFFGIGSLVARGLVPEDRTSSAVSVMFGGLTLANVVGVPFGSFVGAHGGWRATFWILAAIGSCTLTGLAVWLPRQEAAGRPARHGVRPGGGRQVWLTLVATALGYGSMFGAFSYLAYTLTRVSGFSTGDMPWLLAVYGVGLVVGNIAGGRAADRDRDLTLLASFGGLLVTLPVFGLVSTSPSASVVSLFLTGLFGFASVPGLIVRVTEYAHDADLAASANVSASNVGIAAGSWVCGLTLSFGLGFRAPLYAASAIALAASAVLTAAVLDARGADPDDVS